MYLGAKLFKNLNTLAAMNCLTLSATGSQLIFLRCLYRIPSLLPRKRQQRIHLFCAICSLVLRSCVKFGYHALQAKSKCGWIKVLHSIRLRRGFRHFPCLYKNLSLPLTFFRTFKAISRPDKVSSKRQPRYSTVENCFRVTSCLFMTIGSALFRWFLGLKRIDFVLSSPT